MNSKHSIPFGEDALTHALVVHGRIVAIGDVVTCEEVRDTFTEPTHIYELGSSLRGALECKDGRGLE